MRAAIITVLKTGVALVSTRVYGGYLPSSVLAPCIRVTMISDRRIYAFGGSIGHSEPRVQVDVFGRNYNEMAAVGRQVVSALDGWSISAVKFVGLVGANERYDEDAKLFHLAIDYQVLYRW